MRRRKLKVTEMLVCQRCSKTDSTTSIHMHCPDCNNAVNRATLCRECCPTGHGTHPEVMEVPNAS